MVLRSNYVLGLWLVRGRKKGVQSFERNGRDYDQYRIPARTGIHESSWPIDLAPVIGGNPLTHTPPNEPLA